MIWEVLTVSANPGAAPRWMCRREHRLHPPVVGALQRRGLLEKDRKPEGRDQRRLGRHLAQRPEHQPLGRQPVRRPDACDQRQHGEQRERQRPEPEQRERGDRDEGGVRADDRDLAECQIDPVEDAVDQGVADREQTVEAAEREPVDHELQEVQEITRPRACGLGAPSSRGLRLVQIEPVAAQHEHRDLGQAPSRAVTTPVRRSRSRAKPLPPKRHEIQLPSDAPCAPTSRYSIRTALATAGSAVPRMTSIRASSASIAGIRRSQILSCSTSAWAHPASDQARPRAASAPHARPYRCAAAKACPRMLRRPVAPVPPA